MDKPFKYNDEGRKPVIHMTFKDMENKIFLSVCTYFIKTQKYVQG